MRLDAALVKRGLADSRNDASRMIEVGVLCDCRWGVCKQGVTHDFCRGTNRSHRWDKRFVSRGGEKMLHALEHFGVSVEYRSVLGCRSVNGWLHRLCAVATRLRGSLVLMWGATTIARKDQIASPGGMARRSQCSHTWVDLIFPLPALLSLLICRVYLPHKKFCHLMDVVSPEIGLSDTPSWCWSSPSLSLVGWKCPAAKGSSPTQPFMPKPMHWSQKLWSSCVRVVGVVESPIKGAEGNTEFLM